jgi:malonate transporter MadL subunit
MTIYGVALLAACTVLGVFLGEALGAALHVKANVGGVGIAMILLIGARLWISRKGEMSHGLKLGVEFWALMYIPIVVAMAATQNVAAAVEGGPMVLLAGVTVVAACFGLVALLGKLMKPRTPSVTPPDAAIISGEPD